MSLSSQISISSCLLLPKLKVELLHISLPGLKRCLENLAQGGLLEIIPNINNWKNINLLLHSNHVPMQIMDVIMSVCQPQQFKMVDVVQAGDHRSRHNHCLEVLIYSYMFFQA